MVAEAGLAMPVFPEAIRDHRSQQFQCKALEIHEGALRAHLQALQEQMQLAANQGNILSCDGME